MSADRWLCEVPDWEYGWTGEPDSTPPPRLFYIFGDCDGYSMYGIEQYCEETGKKDWSPKNGWNLYDGLLPEDVDKPVPQGRCGPDYSMPGGRTIYRKYFVKRYGVKVWNRIYGKNFDKE